MIRMKAKKNERENNNDSYKIEKADKLLFSTLGIYYTQLY